MTIKMKYQLTPILFAGIFACSSIINAEDISWVKYGWQAFRNSGDASSMSLGGTMTAFSNSSASVLHNPAHIGTDHIHSFIYAHQNRFNGVVETDLLFMKYQTQSKRNIGLAILHESVSNIMDTRSSLLDWGLDGIPNTGDPGEGNGIIDEGERLDVNRLKAFNQHQWALHFTTGWQLKGYQIGVATKGLFHSLGEHTGTGFGFDLGVVKAFTPRTQIGVSVYDVLTSWVIWDNGSKEVTSPTAAVGASHQLDFSRLPVHIAVMGDVLLHTEGRSLSDHFHIGDVGGSFRFGIETVINHYTVLRLGKNEHDIYSAGLGVQWEAIDINYAYQISTVDADLGNSHVLSFAVDPVTLFRLVTDSMSSVTTD